MLSSSTRRSLLASTIIAGSLISTQALAQGGAQGGINAGTNAQQTEGEPVVNSDTIVVTGSLIQNPNLTSATPIATIGQDEVLLRQTQTAEQILRQLPGAVPAIGENVNNGSNGSATVNLRGLGQNRNLVLLDGARIVATSNDGATDLNNIPLSLVQRVDVLTGGASTTYGADAVSGVVNFITRRDFTGLELQVQEAITERGDANRLRADLTIGAGFDDGRGNVVLSLGYQEADPLYQDARPISFTGITSNTGISGGESFTSTPTGISFPTPGDLQIAPDGSSLVPFYAGFNFNPYNVFQTPLERYNMYAAAHYDASDSVTVYGRGLFTKTSVSTIIAPSGIFGTALCVNPDNPFLNATIRAQIIANNAASGTAFQCDTNIALTGAQTRTPNAGAGFLTLPTTYRRAVELGPRISEYVSQVFDFRAGVQIGITDNIKFDGYGAYGETDRTETRSGYYAISRVRQALIATTPTTCTVNTNGCVPLNIFGPSGSITAAQNAFVGGITSSVKNFQSLAQAHGVVSGDLGFNSPFSEESVAFALGGEFRREVSRRSPDNLAQVPGELGGAGGAVTPLSGGFKVYEAFGELKVPLVSDRPFFNELTVEGGVRYSSYKIDNGRKFNATTYKVGGTWSPIEEIKIRGNYQRAVRAPNIGELFAAVSTGLVSLASDPCAGAAPTTNANLRDICLAQGAPAASIGLIQNPSASQANATGGGNPNLSPEKADTYTIGVVLEPRNFIEGLTITADYYNIKVKDAITAPTPFDVITACFGINPTSPPANAASPACTGIRRNPGNGRLSGDPSVTPGLPVPTTNSGRLSTDGIDLTVNYRTSLGFLSDAKLALSFAGNWTNTSKFQAIPGAINRECTGLSSVNCGSIQPEFSWNQRTTLTFGDIDVSLLWRHYSKIDYEGTEADFVARGFNANNRFLFPFANQVASPGLRGGIIGGTGPLAGTGPYDFNHIEAYDYFDLTTRFGLTKNLDVTLTVANLFDKDPPLVGATGFNTTGFNSGNTLPSTYDALGRRYSATVRLKF